MSVDPILCAEQIRFELEKILAASCFSKSKKLSGFLRFSVENALAGDANVKEQVIAIEVFGRNGDFDPRLDPIVRVQARRLRAKLSTYYSTEGLFDSIVVEMPKGGYRPVFNSREALPASSERSPIRERPEPAEHSPTIAVLPFLPLFQDRTYEWLPEAIREEVINGLTRNTSARVISRTALAGHGVREGGVAALAELLDFDLAVEGAVRFEGERLRVTSQLIRVDQESCVAAFSCVREIDDRYAVIEQLANNIVAAISARL